MSAGNIGLRVYKVCPAPHGRCWKYDYRCWLYAYRRGDRIDSEVVVMPTCKLEEDTDIKHLAPKYKAEVLTRECERYFAWNLKYLKILLTKLGLPYKIEFLKGY